MEARGGERRPRLRVMLHSMGCADGEVTTRRRTAALPWSDHRAGAVGALV